MNRNHIFLIGLVVLFLGIQFRRVEKYVLNEQVSRALNERDKQLPEFSEPPKKNSFFAQRAPASPTASLNVPVARRVLSPPKWLGWVCVSVGGVLVLQSLAMRKPGG